MSDSLVISGQIELLGDDGGTVSDIPACAGATFALAPDYDLSAPQTVADIMTASLLDGERPTRRRVGNRLFTLPVKITAPDRDTLAAAREVLLELCDEDFWRLTWTRDGGLPVIFDCFQALPAQPANQLFEEQELVERLTVQFPGLPYGHSDQALPVLFNCPSQVFDLPPAPVTLDAFGTAANFLDGDASDFETDISHWTGAGNDTIARSTAQAHSGAGSLALTSQASGNMQAASCLATDYNNYGMAVLAGQTLTMAAYSRAAVSARTTSIGADFYDANGTVVGSRLSGTGVADSTSAWAALTASLTVPAGAVWARANAQVLATGAANEVHYFDDISMSAGPVYSYDDPPQWTQSTATPITSQHSAKWSRTWHDRPKYSRNLPAPIDITGRDRITFWAGLATASSQWSTWHSGAVTFEVTLSDANENVLSFSRKQTCAASALDNLPHWQMISMPIPQQTAGFDYTTVSMYSITAYNMWQTTYGPVLQSGFFLAAVAAAASSTGSPVARGAWYTIPGPTGSARSPIAFQASPGPSSYSTTADFPAAGTQSWTAPVGVTSVDKAECWGGGGGGAGSNGSANGGGGGGGGEYAMRTKIPVTPSTVYHPVVGAAGSGGTVGNMGTWGGDSSFTGDSSVSVKAHGGQPGWKSAGTGNTGGHGGTGSSDPVHFGGGDGYDANADSRDIGGGGGGSAGPNGGGRSATDRPGAVAVPSGGPGGNGGYSSSLTPHQGSAPPAGPGGGGGGGNDGGAGYNGGAGFAGRVRLTYGASGILPLNSLLLHMPGRGAPHALNPLCPAGNGADVPDGREYTVPAVSALNARFDGAYTLFAVAGTWSSPSTPRLLTVTIRQYPYTGGAAVVLPVTRTVTPSTDPDIINGFVDMGPVTLPLAELPPGQLQGYFTIGITSAISADRFLDFLLLDVTGQTLLINVSGASVLNNIWADEADQNRALGGVYGSYADRDQAQSVTSSVARWSGGGFAVEPGQNNRLLTYSAQGAPAVTGWYVPHWWMDRTDQAVAGL